MVGNEVFSQRRTSRSKKERECKQMNTQTRLNPKATHHFSISFYASVSIASFSFDNTYAKGPHCNYSNSTFQNFTELLYTQQIKRMTSDTLQIIQCGKGENKSGFSFLVYLFYIKYKRQCLINPIEACAMHCSNEQYTSRRDRDLFCSNSWMTSFQLNHGTSKIKEKNESHSEAV